MGFIRMSGGLLPMAVETYLLSSEPLDVADQEGDDFEVYEQFQQSGRLKELRLLALRVLTALEGKEAQNRFIKEYLRSRSAGDVFSLLDETLTETDADPELLSALREEALKEEVDRLSDEQKAVYESPLNESTIVSAGPGSGKTHTLLLRLARLIHEENVSPSQILVLAYNRAVVTEVKSRLRKLLKTLGYRDLSRRLRVFTFHGLIRYVLGDEVQTEDLTGEDGDTWVETFNRITENRPGRIGMHLSPDTIRFIFVDEFQDITEERYQMLSWIAGDSSQVTAIGDPDQSIYGYQRAENNQARSAEPFFERFSEDFDATEYQITDNFRSLPKVVEHADRFIRLNEHRNARDTLVPQRECPDEWTFSDSYVETAPHDQFAWLQRIPKLLQEEGPDGKRPRDVAVLYRSNAEVYRGYRLIQNHLGDVLRQNDIPIVVQGANRNWMRIREIAFCIEQLQSFQQTETGTATFPVDKSVWDELIETEERSLPSVWDDYTLRLLRCMIDRFEQEQTDDFPVADLIDYIQDTFRRDRGQIYKLLQIHEEEKHEEGKRTPSLVLSNLHKVKGLEYDVVVMPASFQPLPFSNSDADIPPEEINDVIEEERRVYYVGMTRARNRLVRYTWRREENLRKGIPFDREGSASRQLGMSLDADAFAGHIIISSSADERFLRQKGEFENGEEYLDYMTLQVQSGDPLTLVRRNGRWYVQHNETIIAQVARALSNQLDREVGDKRGDLQAEGVVVSDVVRYTHEDSREYDEKNNKSYTERWSKVFCDKGYTYLVNFAGFVRFD
jgi:ATP-dependent DNA helicase RecQ